MGKKDQTATTSQTQTYTPTGANQLQDIWNKIQGVTSQGYQPYTGQLAAGLDPTQQAGINTINNAVGTAQPYFDQAAQYARSGAAAITPQQISQYMSPYTQQVIDATQAQFANQNKQQQQQVIGNAALQGALGGDRVGVAQAELANQQNLAQNPVIANLYNQGYSQALGAAQADRAAQAQGAYTFGALAPAVQNTALQGGQAQLGAGAVGQGTQQNALNAAYQQYLQQQAFPYQQAQFLAQYGLPTITAMGGTQTGAGTQTTPGPSPWGQLLGLGTAAISAFSDERVKDNIEKVGKTFDGQNIYSFTYKGDDTPRMGLMAQEVEKKNPDAVGEVSGIKTVNYKKATAKAAKKGKFARGGAVDYSDVSSYIPSGAGGISDLTPKMTPMQMPGSSGQGGSGMPSTSDMKGFMGGAKGLFDNLNIFPAEGGNYAANMAGPAMVGNTGTGMVIGGLKDGGRVGKHAYALGGFIPNYIEGSDAPVSIPLVDPDKTIRPTLVSNGAAQSASPAPTTPFEARWSGDTASPFSGTSLNSVPADVALASASRTPVDAEPAPLPVPRPQPVTGLGQTPANANVTQATPTAGYADNIERYGNSISGIESGGKYDALGPVIEKTGDRAYGKYQIMGANIPQWTKEILGKPMTPQEFLANPQAQDAVFKGKFGQYVNKYGPEGASRAWFAGEGGMNNPMARDQLGTTVADYSSKFLNNLGMPSGGQSIDVAGNDQIPPNATLTQAKPVQQQSSLGGWNPFNLSDDARTALLSAGLGMMASRSPFALTQIGEGGLQGVKAYTDLKQVAADRAMKQQQLDLQAKNMARQADQFAQEYGLKKSAQDFAREKYDVPAGWRKTDDGRLEPIPGGPNDPATIRAAAEAKRLPGMSDEALSQMVDSYRAGNTGVLVGVGRGTQGSDNLNRFWNIMSQKLKEEGATGKDLASAKANFTAQSAAARTAAVREANVAAAVEEAKQTFPLALQRSEELPRTMFVPWNKAVQAVQAGTSSPELARFVTANQAVITAYSQAMSRTGVNTVHAQQHAENLLSTATSPEAYRAVIGQMQQEMDAALASPEAVKSRILRGISGREGEATTSAPTKQQSFTGRTATGPNGQKLRETTDGKWVP